MSVVMIIVVMVNDHSHHLKAAKHDKFFINMKFHV